jgi:sugar/nucleoside kinase (ribokinase family)
MKTKKQLKDLEMSEPILVVGSIAYDSIKTPNKNEASVPGGSALYFSNAASLYSKIFLVGVVGEDFSEREVSQLRSRGVDLTGLQIQKGETFKWSGEYKEDFNEAITHDTQLNVFASFNPVIPKTLQQAKILFLANIDPVLQLRVLDQMERPTLIGMDTMNYWINTKKDELLKMLPKVDVLLINETEAKQLSQKKNTLQAVRSLSELGPKVVVIKRGEYGFLMYSRIEDAAYPFFSLPSFPVEKVVDPTGAGDTFAAGFFGCLSKLQAPYKTSDFKLACVHGAVLASFTVQDFGLRAFEDLNWAKVEGRLNEYEKVVAKD